MCGTWLPQHGGGGCCVAVGVLTVPARGVLAAGGLVQAFSQLRHLAATALTAWLWCLGQRHFSDGCMLVMLHCVWCRT
jgi:hypothetical protein